MSDFKIVQGTVEYEHKNPGPKDYEQVTPKVMLTFEVAEGADPEAVVQRVMSMARAAVDGKPAEVQADPPTQSRRGRKPTDTVTLVSGQDVEPIAKVTENPLAELAGSAQPQEPAKNEAASDEQDDLSFLESGPAPKTAVVPTLEDIKSACQKASAHLRKEFGHMNDITKLLAAFGVPGYGHLPEDKRKDFMDKVLALCDLKK